MKQRPQLPLKILVFLTFASAGWQATLGQQKGLEGDLDTFMSKVLRRRETNWDQLHNYVFSEREVFEIKGMKLAPLESFRRDYTWFVRDGYLIRSPTRINGVKVSKKEQAAVEEEYVRRAKRRRNNLDQDAFFKFKFEPGSYVYAGREKFEGRDVVVVEYYPSRKSAATNRMKRNTSACSRRRFLSPC